VPSSVLNGPTDSPPPQVHPTRSKCARFSAGYLPVSASNGYKGPDTSKAPVTGRIPQSPHWDGGDSPCTRRPAEKPPARVSTGLEATKITALKNPLRCRLHLGRWIICPGAKSYCAPSVRGEPVRAISNIHSRRQQQASRGAGSRHMQGCCGATWANSLQPLGGCAHA
jgi:hypothetical protein